MFRGHIGVIWGGILRSNLKGEGLTKPSHI